MQTFLPYPSFSESAHCLDNKRLGKQRVETIQILKALSNPTYGWQNHPAVKMWKGYKGSLIVYGLAICEKWILRGYKDTCRDKILDFVDTKMTTSEYYIPQWITPEFCLSHKSNLIRKNPEHYIPIFGSDIPSNLPYVWPC